MTWLAAIMILLSLTIFVRCIHLTKNNPESETLMPEDKNNEIPPVGLAELLASLQDGTETKIGEVIDLNRDIVLATRKMAHNILKLRQAHIEEADRLFSIASDLIDSAVVSSTIAADLIDVEFGGELIDFTKFHQQQGDDFEDDDDDA